MDKKGFYASSRATVRDIIFKKDFSNSLQSGSFGKGIYFCIDENTELIMSNIFEFVFDPPDITPPAILSAEIYVDFNRLIDLDDDKMNKILDCPIKKIQRNVEPGHTYEKARMLLLEKFIKNGKVDAVVGTLQKKNDSSLRLRFINLKNDSFIKKDTIRKENLHD